MRPIWDYWGLYSGLHYNILGIILKTVLGTILGTIGICWALLGRFGAACLGSDGLYDPELAKAPVLRVLGCPAGA